MKIHAFESGPDGARQFAEILLQSAQSRPDLMELVEALKNDPQVDKEDAFSLGFLTGAGIAAMECQLGHLIPVGEG